MKVADFQLTATRGYQCALGVDFTLNGFTFLTWLDFLWLSHNTWEPTIHNYIILFTDFETDRHLLWTVYHIHTLKIHEQK